MAAVSVVALVAVLGVLPAGASTSAMTAQAKKDLLARSDMPKGWYTESGGTPTKQALYPTGGSHGEQCLGEPAGLPTTVPPEVDSPYYSSEDGSLEVQESISIFANAAQAKASFNTFASAKVAPCLAAVFNQAPAPKGGKLGTVTVSPPLGPMYGPHTNGFVVLTPAALQGATYTINTTAVYFVRGNLGQQLRFTIYRNPGSNADYPASVIRHLTKVAQERL
jgi:hypothetical protein